MKNKDKVSIYRRILKYPPFAVKKKSGAMEIIHHTKNGKVVARAAEYVTTEDAEKLFCIIYIAQKNNTVKTVNVNDKDFGDIIRIDVEIKNIKKITNNHDERSVLNSIDRLQNLSITYFELEKNKIISQIGIHPLLKYKFEANTVLLTLYLDKNFYEACDSKALQINISKYAKLGNTAKNLYGFIATNSGDIFTEDLLAERAVIQNKNSRKCEIQRGIKRALTELKAEHIIKDYSLTKKDGIRFISIEREIN